MSSREGSLEAKGAFRQVQEQWAPEAFKAIVEHVERHVGSAGEAVDVQAVDRAGDSETVSALLTAEATAEVASEVAAEAAAEATAATAAEVAAAAALRTQR